MDFSKLNQIKEAKKSYKKKRASEFDAHSFLEAADKLPIFVDEYFVKEPNVFLDAMDKFDVSNDFAIFEMETSAAEIIKRFL